MFRRGIWRYARVGTACFLVAGHTLIASAQLGADTCKVRAGPSATVVEVIDGDTVVLDDDSQVRLVGIQAPKLPLGRRGFRKWPRADEARQALSTLVLDRQVRLNRAGLDRDRHGRHLAHLTVDRGGETVWIQDVMIRRGLARAYSFPDNRACARALQEAETEARAAGRGIWSLDYYRVRDAGNPEMLRSLADSFQLVEGVVRSVAVLRQRAYLNFGDDYRTDFTIGVDRRDLRHFPDRGEWLNRLEGRKVRVRGWITNVNGPMIEVSHPEQIEPL